MTSAMNKAQLRGVHVLLMLLAFFVVVFAVNGVFIYQALSTFPGETAPHAYVQGLNYNQTIAERRAEAELGWRVGAAFAPGAEGVDIETRVVDKNGIPLSGLKLSGAIERLVEAGDDHDVTFQELGEGRYVAHLPAIAQGAWRLEASAEDAAGHKRDFARIMMWRRKTP